MSLLSNSLNDELRRRRKKRPGYSLRNYARSLDIDPGLLSKFLSGKRHPSVKMAKNLAEKLTLDSKAADLLVQSVIDARTNEKLNAALPHLADPEIENWSEVDQDTFDAISKLYHYGLLELTFTQGLHPMPVGSPNDLISL